MQYIIKLSLFRNTSSVDTNLVTSPGAEAWNIRCISIMVLAPIVIWSTSHKPLLESRGVN